MLGGSRDCESRTSVSSAMMVETTKSSAENEEQTKRMESIQQENRVLKMEVETYKLKCKQLQEDNRELRKASVSIVSGWTRMGASYLRWCVSCGRHFAGVDCRVGYV